ncbi:MAG: fumarylacetoacetate hydrolase family protein [Thermoleophilia bacterium]
MKIANVSGRAAIAVDGGFVDVESASGGTLPSDPMALLERLDEARAWQVPADAPRIASPTLGPPVPRPSKILAIGLNYRLHAEESGMALPERPVVFTKLPSALTGPYDPIEMPSDRTSVDWEVELVLVVGRRGRYIPAADAWSYMAGVTCGQDVSDREEQMRDLKQFTMAKSFDTYGPIGPVMTTVDELANPDDLAISCSIDGRLMQSSRTSDFIFDVGQVVEHVSRVCTLEVGDLIFTGTPAGVGMGQKPPWFLQPGMVVETEVEGVGSMRNEVVAGPPYGG